MHAPSFGMPMAWLVSIVFVIVLALPVWLAARVVGADSPTLLRSVGALLLGTLGAVAAMALGGLLGVLLAPLSYLLAFQFVLGTSFLGSVVLAVLAAAGYVALGRVLG